MSDRKETKGDLYVKMTKLINIFIDEDFPAAVRESAKKEAVKKIKEFTIKGEQV